MKKQFEEEDRKRLLALKRRKSPEVPKTDYTFGFDGQILKKKGKITR